MRVPTNAAMVILATLLIGSLGYLATLRAGQASAVGAVASPSPSPTPIPSPTPARETPTPSPTNKLFVVDEEVVDNRNTWMLVTNCPIARTCEYSVTRSADSGHHWMTPVQVGPSFDAGDGEAPRTIRFQSLEDGFVYGYAGAYVTHNAGLNWQKLDLPATSVYSIAISSDRVWATTRPCVKGTDCRLEVRSSTDAGRTWSDAHQLPMDFSPQMPVAFHNGLIMSRVPTGDIELTIDAGASWHSIKSSCAENPFQGFATTVDGVELWLACAGQPDQNGNATNKSLFVSEDGGKTWSPRDPKPLGPIPLSLTPGRTGVAFVANYAASMVTRDGGKTWSELAKDGVKFRLIRFRTATHGWAIGGPTDVYETADGGDTWSLVGSITYTFN